MRPVNTVWSWLGSSKWRVADTMLHSVANGTYTHTAWITRPLIAVDVAKHSTQLPLCPYLKIFTDRIKRPVNICIKIAI